MVFTAASHAGDASAPPAAPLASASPADSSSLAPAAPPTPAPAPAPATTAKESAPPAPEMKPEPKPVAKPEPKPEAKAAEKPLDACAAKLEPVADSYRQAHDSLLAWLRTASAKMDAVDDKIADLKKLIAEKEARITQLKLEAAPKNDAQARTLDQETRGLWTQLKAEEARRKELCRALSTAAGREVRELNRSVLEQFEKAVQTQ
jgi:hypothetical protein